MENTGLAKRGRFSSNAVGSKGGYCRYTDAGSAQSGKPMLIDGELPGKEFVDGEGIAAPGLLEGEQAAAHRGNDFSLAANNPPLSPGSGQIRDC